MGREQNFCPDQLCSQSLQHPPAIFLMMFISLSNWILPSEDRATSDYDYSHNCCPKASLMQCLNSGVKQDPGYIIAAPKNALTSKFKRSHLKYFPRYSWPLLTQQLPQCFMNPLELSATPVQCHLMHTLHTSTQSNELCRITLQLSFLCFCVIL